MQLKVALLTSDSRLGIAQAGASYPIFGTAPSALLEGFAGNPQIEVHVISCVQQRMSSPTELFKNIRFHCLYVPKWGWLRTGYAGCILAVRNVLQKIRPDLVHAQGTERDCAISGLSFRGPRLLTLHGNIRRVAKILKAPPFSYWWLQARLENWVLPRFDGVICLSHHAEKQVHRKARKTWVFPNAVDHSFFGINRAPVAPARILCVATISPLKNQLGLIQALEAYHFSFPFELHFFGCLDSASNYGKVFLRSVSKNSSFFYGGLLDRAGLKSELSKASALFLPTFEENCPMVILEAQAAGVPVIASNVGGVPDLIQDGVTGILSDPSQPETMAKALLRLLEEPALGRRLAEKAKKQALARFHPRVTAEKHLEIYRQVIAPR